MLGKALLATAALVLCIAGAVAISWHSSGTADAPDPDPMPTVPPRMDAVPVSEVVEEPAAPENALRWDLGMEMDVPPDWPYQPLSGFEEVAIDVMLVLVEDARHYHTWSFAEPGSVALAVPTSISLEVIQPPELHDAILGFISLETDIRIQSEGEGVMGGLPAETTEYVLVDVNGEVPTTKLAETRVVLDGTMFVVSYGAELDQYPLHLHHYRAAVDSFVPPESPFSLPERQPVMPDVRVHMVDVLVDRIDVVGMGPAGATVEMGLTLSNGNVEPVAVSTVKYKIRAGGETVAVGQFGPQAPGYVVPAGGSTAITETVNAGRTPQFWGGLGAGGLSVSGEAMVHTYPGGPGEWVAFGLPWG